MKLLTSENNLIALNKKFVGVTFPETPPNEGGDPVIPATKMSYTKEMTDSQWMRIAKVTDIANNSSGIFTFNCFAVDEEGTSTQLSSSVFSLSCGINSKQEFIADITPLTQSPEVQLKASNATENGSGETGSGDTGSGEPMEVSSGEAGSGEAGSGSSSNLYGLNSVKLEWYKGEIYVCGLVGFPSVDLYKILNVDMLIENNLNFEYLEDLEIIDFSLVEENGLNVSEGMMLPVGNDYELRTTVNLAKYVEALNNQEPIEYILKSGEKELPIIKYNEDGYQFYNTSFINYTYQPRNFFLITIPAFDNYILRGGIGGDLHTVSYKFKILNENYVSNLSYAAMRYISLNIKKISGKLKCELDNCKITIKLNEEIIAEDLEPGNDFEYLIEDINENTEIEYIATPIDISTLNMHFDFKLEVIKEDTELELSIPFEMKEDFIIDEIHNNTGTTFDFDFKLYEMFKHETTEPYTLYSLYRRNEELKKQIFNLQNDVEYAKESFKTELSEGIRGVVKLMTYTNAEEIYAHAFEGDNIFLFVENLTLPNTKKIGRRAFASTSLKQINLPEVLEIESGAFEDTPFEQEFLVINMPKIEVIHLGVFTKRVQPTEWGGAFYMPSTLREVYGNSFADIDYIEVDPNNIKYDSREGCNAIIETETNTVIVGTNNTWLPESVKYIGDSAFYNKKGIYIIDFPYIEEVKHSAFKNCYNLITASFEQCHTIGPYAFFQCGALQEIYLPACLYIGYMAFTNCDDLQSVYLNVSSVPVLEGIDTFAGTPIANGEGSIYVPASLYEEFCNATNWNVFADRIVSYF